MFEMYEDYKFNLEKDCYENIKNGNYFFITEIEKGKYKTVFYSKSGNKILERNFFENNNFEKELKIIINEVEK